MKGVRVLSMMLSVILIAKLGTIQYEGHKETWYNLNMNKVIERADSATGLDDMYWVRDDGCKMYGPWVIVAAHPSKIRYTFVETSRGTGIILDAHTAGDMELIDIATNW